MISVVVPTYQRPAQLRRCLDGLAALAPPDGGFEVLLVDDGGTTALEPIVDPLHGTLDVVLLRERHAGPAAARNAGAQRATRPYLAFLDDDCVPERDWLRAFARRLASAPEEAVGGRTLNGLPDNLYASASQLLVDYLYEYHNDDRAPSFFASNNVAVARERFLAIGGFDASFQGAAGEDRDFCDRWQRRGWRMTYAPEAVVQHAHALTLRTFWRQHFTYGRGAFVFRQARALRSGGRIAFEPPRFYVRLLGSPFARQRGTRMLRLAVALLVAQVANASGFAWEGRLRRERAPRLADELLDVPERSQPPVPRGRSGSSGSAP